MVQTGSTTTQVLDNLPPRPPTPPRESENKESRSAIKYSITKQLQAHTPPNQSPSSSAEPREFVSDKQQKKVEWSPWTEYKDAPKVSEKNDSPSQRGKLRPLPPSGEKPIKSILKPYNGIIAIDKSQPTSQLSPPHTYPNFATMLESIVKQLAGADRNSRLDAYLTLSGVLKAAENIPDPSALREKMGLLSQFIQRDITARSPSGSLDTQIINNALITLATLLWKLGNGDSFPADFSIFFMEHAISALEGSTMPKDVIKHIMFILGQQNFSPKVMTPDRTGRLLVALQEIEEHVKGRSIILGRLNIYRKLLRQARNSMLSSVDWVEHLFTDMLSNFKDLREAAISFGFEASFALGAEKHASRAVTELLKIEQEDGTKYATYYAGRLSSMVKKKQNGSSVPQIWSIVILFLRHRPHQIEHWEFMRPWLQIIQECFNNSDHDVKVQANLAWNRLVFAIRPDETTASTMAKMLGQPLSGQLKRKLVGKNARLSRQTTIDSICNLLYYTLKPTASAAQLDMYWDEHIVQLVGSSLVSREHADIESARDDLNQACAILQALFDSPKSNVWNENRAMEGGPIQVTELPSIDARWVRRNAPRVFVALGPLIEKCYWDLSNPDSPIVSVWHSFATCIASAGAKEIKVSNDTMVSMASTFNMFCKLWHKGPRNIQAIETGGSLQFLKGFEVLVNAMTASLGILPFTEKLLSISQQDTFAVVATPSHRPSKALGDVKCPFHHLVTLMAQPSSDLKCDENFYQTARLIVRPFFEARKSKWPRVELARDLVQLLKADPKSSASVILWQIFAEAVTAALKHSDGGNSSSGSLDQPLGAEYRNIIRVLESGLALSPEEPLPEWKQLFGEACSQITTDVGDSGRAISIIEPLARILQPNDTAMQPATGTAYCLLVVNEATYPRERNVLDAARRRLWGAVNAGPKSSSLDPFNRLYTLLDQSLSDSYKLMTNDSLEACTQLLTSVTNLIRRCPVEHVLNLLSKIQNGASPWISDFDSKLAGRAGSSVFIATAAFWAVVCSTISHLPCTDSNTLQVLDQLMCAGLQSKHRGIVVSTVNLWNGTFGRENQLDYSIRLQEAIRRIRSIADLQLPSFPGSLDSENFGAIPSFFDDSQDDESYASSPANISSRDRHRTSQPNPSSLSTGGLRSSPRIEVVQSIPRKRPHEGTPEPSRRKVSKGNLTPKFKHNDSQIEFAVIESSPLGEAVLDSQPLTDRQLEVKERQKAESALFPELRSSPRTRTKSGLVKLNTSSDLPSPALSAVVNPTTPEILSRNKDAFDNYVTSSPTPRRGSAIMGIDSDAIEPPSSPPERVVDENTGEVADVLERSNENPIEESREPWEVTSSLTGKSSQVEWMYDLPEKRNVRSIEEPSAKLVEEFPEEQTDCNPVFRPATPTRSLSSTSVEQRTPKTPMDMFVDALSTPAPPTPAMGSVSNSTHQSSLVLPRRDLSSVFSGAVDGVEPSTKKTFSSLSELDESSMLRLLSEVDGLDNAAAAETLNEAAGNSSLPGVLNTQDDAVAPKEVTDTTNSTEFGHNNTSPDVSDSIAVTPKSKPKARNSAKIEVDQTELGNEAARPVRVSSRHATRKRTLSKTVSETPAKAPTNASLETDGESFSEMDSQADESTSGYTKEPTKRRRTSARRYEAEVSDSKKGNELAESIDPEVSDNQEGGALTEKNSNTPTIESAPSSAPSSGPKKGKARRAPKKPYKKRTTRSSQSFEQDAPVPSVTGSLHEFDLTVDENAGREVDSNMDSEPVEYEESSIASTTNKNSNGNSSGVKSEDVAVDTSFLSGAQIVNQSAEEFVDLSVDMVAMSGNERSQENAASTSVIHQFRELIASLKGVVLMRGDAGIVDDLMWDLKKEVCDAERRGRGMSREGSGGATRD